MNSPEERHQRVTRQDQQQARRIGFEPDRTRGLVRGAHAPVGGKVQPVDGPSQPGGPPGHRGHRKERHARARFQIKAQLWRSKAQDIVPAQEHTALVGPCREPIEHRKLVIDTGPEEPQPEDQGGRDIAQAFVEIRAVLFRDVVKPLRRKVRAGRIIERIEIADYGLGLVSLCQNGRRAAIGCNKAVCMRTHGLKIIGQKLTAADKNDWFEAGNNRLDWGQFAVFR